MRGAETLKVSQTLRVFVLFDELCSWDNLYLAYRLAAKGKRSRAAAAAFEYRLEDNLFELQDELQSQTYHPGPYRSFYIFEPKRRLISAAPFRDRVVHHALCNLVEPIFERSFIYDSYANRVGKGTHRALDRCQQFAREARYVLACDIKQFFPSIDHMILHGILSEKIKDAQTMWLVDSIISSGIGVLSESYEMEWFPGDDLLAALRPRGLPIGNLTSQIWANCYLNHFDHFVQRELGCTRYIRYVDDFLLFGDEKDVLFRWLWQIVQRLAGLRLTIHASAQARPVEEGISFLGFRVFRERRRLKVRKVVHFRRSLKKRVNDYVAGKITLETLSSSIQGWVNHASYANTSALRESVLKIKIPKRGS